MDNGTDDSDWYETRLCLRGLSCIPDDPDSTETTPESSCFAKRQPGERCKRDDECAAFTGAPVEVCVDKKCVEKVEGQACFVSAECEAGLFCSSSNCAKYLVDGAVCTPFSECEGTLTCGADLENPSGDRHCEKRGRKKLGEACVSAAECKDFPDAICTGAGIGGGR